MIIKQRLFILTFSLFSAFFIFGQDKQLPQTFTIVNDMSAYPTGFTPNHLKAPCTPTSCSTPITIALGALGTQVCAPIQCNDADQTAGPDFPGNNCYDLPNPTIWYAVTPPAGTATLQINVTSSTTNPMFAVYSSTNCSTFTIYDDADECYTGSAGAVSGNMAVPNNGTVILIGVSAPAGQTGTFNICVTPQADLSACNVNNTLVVSATSMGSPLAGPYVPGEVVSFCYTINQYTQTNCNWLQGIVPTFGNCWAPSSFNAQGMPVSITTPLVQAGSFCAGAWAWWPSGSVLYNSTSANVGAGWFFSQPAGLDPDNSWGDANGMCASGMGSCDGASSGLSWQVCFNLTVTTDCATNPDCSVSIKTYADGEIGSWTSLGCVADIPKVLNAGVVCCLMTVNAGIDQTICSNSSTALNGSFANNEGATSVAWTSSPAGAAAGLSNPNSLTPTFTPPIGITGPVTFTLSVTDDACTITDQVLINVTPLPTATISYTGTPFCTSVVGAQAVTLNGTGAYTGGTFTSTAGLTINAATGAITPSSSTPGIYTVTYTIPASGGCPAIPVTSSVTITAVPTASISYTGTPFCTSLVGAQAVTLNGTGAYTGGTFTSAAGLTINASTGAVTPSSSTPGIYTITYTIPASGGCPSLPVTTSVTITAAPTATISYAGTPFCTSLVGGQAVTLNGTGAYTGGTYSSTAGLTLNAATGAVTPSSSTPGIYTVTYTIPASGGCPSLPVTTSVAITAAPTATISYAGTPFCTSLAGAQAVTLNGTGAYTGGTFTSAAGLTLNAVSGAVTPSSSTPGIYTVTYTIPASGGCPSSPVTTSVTITAAPTATISYAGSPFCTSLVGNQAVILNGTGSYTGGTYSSTVGLTLNASTGAITPSSSAPGTYIVTYGIPAGAGCPLTNVTTSVTINPVPVFTVSGTSPTTCNGTDGFIVISGLSNNTNYNVTYNDDAVPVGPTLMLSNGSGQITIGILNAGTYDNIIVSFVGTGCGATDFAGVTLTNPGAPDVFDISNVIICDATYSLPVITGTALSGFESYYTGINGTGTAYAAGTIISVTTPVLYIYDANGLCTDQESFSITINSAPTATISYGTPFCSNTVGAQSVSLNGTGAYTGGTYSSTIGLTINAGTGSITPSTSSAGTYTVTYSIPATGGCPIVDVTTSVTITNPPSATIDYSDPFCNSDATPQVVSLNGTNAYTGGAFSSGAGLTINSVSGDINASTSTAATYTVTYTIPASGGCTSIPVTTSVVITQGPTATISYAGTPYCTTVSGAQLVTLNGTGAFSGGVYSTTVGLSLNAATGSINPSLSTEGIYTVTYTIPASGGCPDSDVTTSLTITAVPTATIDYADPFCSSDVSAQIVTLNGTGAFSGGAFSSSAGLTINGISGDINASTSTPATYTVTYTIPASGGCSAVPVSASVTITDAPTALISYNDPYCEYFIGNAIINMSGTGNYLGGLFSSTVGLTLNTSSGTIVPSSSNPAVYTVTYTIPASGGCGESDVTTTVTINETPVFTVSGIDPTICNGTDGSITISGLNPSTTYNLNYEFNNVSSGIISITTNGSGNYTLTNLGAGQYEGFLLELSGCDGSNASVVTLLNPGAPNISAQSNVTSCDSYQLGAITGTGLTGNEAYYSGTGGTGAQYNAGDFITTSMTIYMYDISGSCDNQSSFVITINNTPSITNPGAQSSCGNYTLPAITGTNLSGNESYFTETGGGGTELNAGSQITTNQTVFIYDYDGNCDSEVSFAITINQLPSVTSVTGGNSYCNGEVVNPIQVGVTGTANWTIDYTLNGVAATTNGASSPISLGNAAGTYVLTGISDANCSNTASGTQTITINAIPLAPVAGTDTTYCTNWDAVAMTAVGSGGTITWYSNSALTAVTSNVPASILGTTIYYVTETANGCEGPANTVTITIQTCDIIVPTAFTPDNDGVNDVWQILDLDAVYSDNVVMVFNRWGNKLFESEKGAYASKPWDGTFEGEALPVGSYYFIIDFNEDDVKPMKGIISIILNK